MTRTLTRDETLMYIMLLAGAGNETTTRLIGWTGKLLSEHPDQRRELAADRSLVPKAIEEILRYEAPSPVQARTVQPRRRVLRPDRARGRASWCWSTARGTATTATSPTVTASTSTANIDHHLSFGYGLHFCLGAALARLEGRRRARRGAAALDRLGRRLGQRQAGAHPQRARLGTPPGAGELTPSRFATSPGRSNGAETTLNLNERSSKFHGDGRSVPRRHGNP